MKRPIAILKPGREVPIRAGHPWVFSMGIDTPPQAEAGELVEVRAHNGTSLGVAQWNPRTNIRLRMMDRDPAATIDAAWFAARLAESVEARAAFLPPQTTGFRVLHAEADGVPGLVVDRYADVVVFQISTAGMDRLRGAVVEGIRAALAPRAIVERSDLDVRRMEGLFDQPVAVRLGSVDGPVPFLEAGLRFEADVLKGQKTGFFLDQRDARLAVGKLAGGRRVLNLFSYAGAFGVHAAAGDASFVANVDASAPALELAGRALRGNGFDPEDEKRFLLLEADVFDLLADPNPPGGPYDLIICDPPALAKTEAHLPQAMKAYLSLNRRCLERLPSGGILVTSSCSGRVTLEDFRDVLRIAAGQSGKTVQALSWITQPVDHPERLAFPEGRYLKTAVLRVV